CYWASQEPEATGPKGSLGDLHLARAGPGEQTHAWLHPRHETPMIVSDNTDALKVFISYSRRDMVFADRLVEALKARGFEVLIDRQSLPKLEDWERELLGFIQQSDTVVFIVSPHSL